MIFMVLITGLFDDPVLASDLERRTTILHIVQSQVGNILLFVKQTHLCTPIRDHFVRGALSFLLSRASTDVIILYIIITWKDTPNRGRGQWISSLITPRVRKTTLRIASLYYR